MKKTRQESTGQKRQTDGDRSCMHISGGGRYDLNLHKNENALPSTTRSESLTRRRSLMKRAKDG